MDKTPVDRRKLSCNRLSSDRQRQKTPVAQDAEDLDLFPCTQEEDKADVVWDWNSPQLKGKSKARIANPGAAARPGEISLRRHNSNNNNVKSFEKLREELRALREDLAVPDSEECLVLSPLEEASFKYRSESAIPSLVDRNQVCDGELEDLFNDSADEDLFLMSQQLEQQLENQAGAGAKRSSEEQVKLIVDDLEDEWNDSFDVSFDPGFVTKASSSSGGTPLRRVKSDLSHKEEQKNVFGTRSQSFGASQKFAESTVPSTQAMICTAEEIEQKRLQAKAKLEAKRQLELIAKKKQEALKKLQLSRQRNAHNHGRPA